MTDFKATRIAGHQFTEALADVTVWAMAHTGYLDEKDDEHRMTHIKGLALDLNERDAVGHFDGAAACAIELAAFALHYVALKRYANLKEPPEAKEGTPEAKEGTHNLGDGRPDFEDFAEQLRAEARWSAALHNKDTTGQAASDQRKLNELAAFVEQIGRRLGFMGPKPKEAP